MREVSYRLAHLGRPRCTVHADHVRAHRIERAERGADLGSRKHAAGQLDGHLNLERDASAGLDHCALAPVESGLRLEQVIDGLYDEEVDTTFEESGSLLLVCVAEVCVPDLTERGELRAGPEIAGHESRMVRCRVQRPRPAARSRQRRC